MKTVLIIEDEVQTRNIFLRCLEFEGFHAVGTGDGITGIALAQKHQPDLVVCDIMMPDIDGYSVLLGLRQRQETASIPFVFLTAKVTMSDLRRGMELGADDYLTKPCSIEQFLAAIATRLQRQEKLERIYSQKFARQRFQTNTRPETDSSLEPASSSAPLISELPVLNQTHSTDIFPDCPPLNAVFDLIESRYCQSLHLNEIAQIVGYSPAYLTTLMQEQTGHTVKRWIIERRMAQARLLLLETQQSIKQIAEATGYTDAGYFSRQFRKLHGTSPHLWRQESVSE